MAGCSDSEFWYPITVQVREPRDRNTEPISPFEAGHPEEGLSA